MKKIIEIFTDSLEDNIYAALVFKPEQVIFLIDANDEEMNIKFQNTSNFLKRRIAHIIIKKVKVDYFRILEINNELVSLIDKNTCIDITGGEDRIKIPLLKYAIDNNLKCCYLDAENEKIIILNNDSTNSFDMVKFNKLNMKQILYLAGALSYNGNYQVDPIDIPYVDEIVELALNDIDRWKRFSFYMGNIYSKYGIGNKVKLVPYHLNIGNKKYSIDISLMKSLSQIGAIKNLIISQNAVSFRYYDKNIRKLINQQGNVLEVYTYLKLYDSNMFEEVAISTIIDWNQNDKNEHKVLNEIDVLARRGRVLYFISCKATELKPEYLNEIIILTKRFGSEESIPVIITTDDINEEQSLIFDRAKKLNCIIVDKDDIKNDRMISKILNR